MATINQNPGTSVVLATTALQSVTNSATVGWKSARVDNTTLKAMDFQVNVQIAAVNTAPANDKSIYIYAVPWYYDGSIWSVGNDGGTITLPSDADAAYTIAAGSGLRLAKVLPYVTQNQPMSASFNLQQVFGTMPDGWQLVVINFCGITLAASGNVIKYKSITYMSA
jgi:hypothetical protein